LKLAARILVGLVLLAAGALKAADPTLAVMAVGAYGLVPPRAALAIGFLLPGVEIAVGAALLTGFLVSLRQRYPRLVDVAVAALLLFSFRESVNAAWAPRMAFAERRRVCNWIEDNIPKGTRIHAEQGLQMWCSILDQTNGPPRISVLDPSADRRRAQFQSIQSGYVITGGANDPIYGCPPCIPRSTELNPARWRLVRAFPEPVPVTEWRFEAVRVWEAVPPAPVAPAPAP